MVFAILFGLSMDYQVFLVSRMREEWDHPADSDTAERDGLAALRPRGHHRRADHDRVFVSFMLGNEPTVKMFGLALASAVLIDASSCG